MFFFFICHDWAQIPFGKERNHKLNRLFNEADAKMFYLGPPQKNNLYQAVSRNVLYPDVIVGTSPWPWDLLCLSHTTPPRSCQLDKAWERPDWRQAQRQCHERMSRYPLGNSMHIESETLYGIVLSAEERMGLRTVGLRRSGPAYYHSQWPHLQSPHLQL